MYTFVGFLQVEIQEFENSLVSHCQMVFWGNSSLSISFTVLVVCLFWFVFQDITFFEFPLV